MIDSLFDDTDPILFEFEHGVAPFAGDSTLAHDDSTFSHWKGTQSTRRGCFWSSYAGCPSRKGFPHVQETIEIVSLFDGMVSSFEELSTDSSGNSTGPVARDEMMGFAEMIGSLVEDTDFLVVEESRTNVQKMMQLLEELNTDDSRDSKVEGCDSGFGELNAHDDVLAENRCAKRGLGTQSERVKRIPSTRGRRSKNFTLERSPTDPAIQTKRSPLEQLCKQLRPLRQKNHRVKPRFKTQCERVKPTVPFALLARPKARPKAVNRECYRNSGTERCLCASSTDTRNVHGVSLVRGSARRPIAQNRIQCFSQREGMAFW